MAWWAWLAAGAVLLMLEMGLIDAGFYLVFLGLAAAIVGFLGLFGFGSSLWEQLLAFGALALILMVGFRRRLYRRLRREPRVHGIEGEVAILRQALLPGALGRAELRGSEWSARNVSGDPLEAGARARVLRVSGLTLEVKGE